MSLNPPGGPSRPGRSALTFPYARLERPCRPVRPRDVERGLAVMARGRPRIYLGAAPGGGKTCAMLGEAHRRAARGTDVVVGFVEDHGRTYTREVQQGLET